MRVEEWVGRSKLEFGLRRHHRHDSVSAILGRSWIIHRPAIDSCWEGGHGSLVVTMAGRIRGAPTSGFRCKQAKRGGVDCLSL